MPRPPSDRVDEGFEICSTEAADLTDARFDDCQFRGANPELAASLKGTQVLIAGMSEAQRAACAVRAATVTGVDNVPARYALGPP